MLTWLLWLGSSGSLLLDVFWMTIAALMVNSLNRDFKDGGYGWVLVGVCFCFGLIFMDGYSSFGVFMIECVERFDMSEKYVTWIGASYTIISGLCGIVVGGLAQQYGHQKVAAFGTILVVCSRIACGLFPDLGFYWLLLNYGIIAGMGCGFQSVVWASAYQDYFQKKIGLANAIVSSGISAGIFLWPPLVEFLFSRFGWMWGFLLNAAIHLHGLPLTLLLAERKIGMLKSREVSLKQADIEQSTVIEKEDLSKLMMPSGEHAVLHYSFPHLYHSESNQMVQIASSEKDINMMKPDVSPLRVGTSLISLVFDKKYSRSLDAFRHLSSNGLDGLTTNTATQQDIGARNDQRSSKIDSSMNKKPHSICDQLQNVIDFSLFQNVPYLLYCIGLGLASFGQAAPFVLLLARAVNSGIDRSPASFLMSILGISNAVSRLFWGNISDIRCLSKYKPLISGGTAILDGITLLISFFAKEYVSIAVFAAMWGFFTGGYNSLQNVLVVHILCGQNVSRGAGTLLTVLGVSWFLSYILCGFLIDIFGNVTSPFFVLGGIEVLGGIIICCVTFF